MDFFAAQDKARQKTGYLVFLFLLAVAGLIAAIYAAVTFGVTSVEYEDGYRPAVWSIERLLWVGLGVIGVVGVSSLMKVSALSSGGGAVARAIGGTLVDPSTKNPKERQLLNIVEEMAIASGVPMPEVYILRNEPGINAFAAGFKPDDAAVAVTQGALDAFPRDELQGVIAHEFGHILNGDMRLNIRLAGIIFGILVLTVIGRIILRASLYSRGGRSEKGGGAVVAMIAAGFTLLVIGYIGVLFGRLIQAAVSRQREFLADASAVQFTRYPDGIAGALKRLGGWNDGAKVDHPEAPEFAHCFFASAFGGGSWNPLATHPPLEKRIAAIDGTFNPDGSLKDGSPASAGMSPVAGVSGLAGTSAQTAQGGTSTRGGAVWASASVEQVGNLTAQAVTEAGNRLSALPPRLREAAEDPVLARAGVLALLAESTEKPVEGSGGLLESELSEEVADALTEMRPFVNGLPGKLRMPFLESILPILRHQPEVDRKVFLQHLQKVIVADEVVDFFEFSLVRLTRQRLLPKPQEGGPPPSAKARARAAREMLTALAMMDSSEHKEEELLALAAEALPEVEQAAAVTSLNAEMLHKALDVLRRTSFSWRRRFLQAAARIVFADGVVSLDEAEMLRAVSASLDCPMPVFSEAA